MREVSLEPGQAAIPSPGARFRCPRRLAGFQGSLLVIRGAVMHELAHHVRDGRRTFGVASVAAVERVIVEGQDLLLRDVGINERLPPLLVVGTRARDGNVRGHGIDRVRVGLEFHHVLLGAVATRADTIEPEPVGFVADSDAQQPRAEDLRGVLGHIGGAVRVVVPRSTVRLTVASAASSRVFSRARSAGPTALTGCAASPR